MNYGDTIKFLATNGTETKRFLLNRSGGATSSGYKLYGYNPIKNAKSLLEDFGIDGNPNHHREIKEARKRIQFYTGKDWDLEIAHQ